MAQSLKNITGVGFTEITALRDRFRRDSSPSRLLRHLLAEYPNAHPLDIIWICEDIFCLNVGESQILYGWLPEPGAGSRLPDERLDERLSKYIEAKRSRWDRDPQE